MDYGELRSKEFVKCCPPDLFQQRNSAQRKYKAHSVKWVWMKEEGIQMHQTVMVPLRFQIHFNLGGGAAGRRAFSPRNRKVQRTATHPWSKQPLYRHINPRAELSPVLARSTVMANLLVPSQFRFLLEVLMFRLCKCGNPALVSLLF